MRRVLVSGGSGLVGRYIVNGLQREGLDVVVGGRSPPPEDWFVGAAAFVPLHLDPDLDQASAFKGCDAFIHAAFDHLPGRYRGGEGDDPDRFHRLNLDGTLKLFEDARRAGVGRIVFLSSRAVYDGLPEGEPLSETADLAPSSLYGQVKFQAEQALIAMQTRGVATTSLRLTGVYGDLRPNKWDDLFERYKSGEPVASRCGSEIHGDDVASAVIAVLSTSEMPHVANLSDLVVDNRDILAPFKRLGAFPHPLPEPADKGSVRSMTTDVIGSLGWTPGGDARLERTLESLAESHLRG